MATLCIQRIDLGAGLVAENLRIELDQPEFPAIVMPPERDLYYRAAGNCGDERWLFEGRGSTLWEAGEAAHKKRNSYLAAMAEVFEPWVANITSNNTGS
jgi:hypothetical protein